MWRPHRSPEGPQGPSEIPGPLVQFMDAGIRPLEFDTWLCHLKYVWSRLVELWVFHFSSRDGGTNSTCLIGLLMSLTFTKCLQKYHGI